MKDGKLKKFLYWSLIATAVFMCFQMVVYSTHIVGWFSKYRDRDISSDILMLGNSLVVISIFRVIVVDALYVAFLYRSVRSLKRDSYFNLRNVYFLVCVAGISILSVFTESVFTLIYKSLPYAISSLAGDLSQSSFMLCIALLYLAAVRTEESEKLTI